MVHKSCLVLFQTEKCKYGTVLSVEKKYPFCGAKRIKLYYVWKLHTTYIKGAVCRILTLLKHNNTIICLQIFKNWPGMSVCYGLWNPPTASLTNCISAPRVASWWKRQRISCHSWSSVLVPVGVVNVATCVCVKSEEEGQSEKNPLQYFAFGLQSYIQHL